MEEKKIKIVALDTAQLSDLDWSAIEALGEVIRYDYTPAEQVIERAEDAQVLLVNKVRLTREVQDKLPSLEYIGVLATGYDNVDGLAAKEKHIPVTNIPGYSTDSVAQLIFALLLELCHHVGSHSEGVTERLEWSNQPYYSYWNFPLVELSGKTMGIVGMGRIGQRTAEIARAFNMKVLAYSRTVKPVAGVEWTDLDGLLSRSDAVAMCCPLTEETRGMMNRSAFEKMKRNAFFINTARGAVVVDEDLRAALDEGLIAGAAADVMTAEPPGADHPLLGAKNMVLTPHIAWATREARERLLRIAGENIAAWAKGSAQNVVNG